MLSYCILQISFLKGEIMKKMIILFLLLTGLIINGIIAQSIDENFNAGGIQIGGNGQYYNDLENTTIFTITPEINIFPIDFLSFGFSTQVSYFTYKNERSPAIYIFSGNVEYTFLVNSNENFGFAVQPGISAGIEPLNDYNNITPYLRVLYFLSPRIAPYIKISAISFHFGDLYARNDKNVMVFLDVKFGMSFFIPTKDKTISAITN